MARKAYNGYPEKSYYDNTMYNGIVATGDPLNEGSFALITNFDISDSGKSLIPRLGYLTTLFEVNGTPVNLSNKIIMYREPNVGKHVIIDLNDLGFGFDGDGLGETGYLNYAAKIFYDSLKNDKFKNAWLHSLTVDPLEISEDSKSADPRKGTAQYPNGETEGVIIPQGVTSIGNYAFWNWRSNNQPLVLPNSVTSIGSDAFTSWTSNNHPLIIPSSVTSIGGNAFSNWVSNNQPLIIPNSVTNISNNAFFNWPLVPYIEIQATTPPTLGGVNAFNNQNNAPIYVPNESVDAYKTATNWVDLADRIFPISELDTNGNLGFIKDNDSTVPFGSGAYLVDITQYNIDDDIISNGHKISNYDTADLYDYFLKVYPDITKIPLTKRMEYIFTNSEPQGVALTPIIDTNGVTQYIIKMKFHITEDDYIHYWLKVMYREKKAPRLETNKLSDTLIFGVVDMTEQTTNFLNRNIASNVSIIPDPLRVMEPASNTASLENVTDVNRPILLNVGGKYLTQRIPLTYKSSLDIKVDTTFYLQNPVSITGNEDTAKWAYRFDIVSTSTLTDYPIYKTPWRELSTVDGYNNIIPKLNLNSAGLVREKYRYYVVGFGSNNTITTTRTSVVAVDNTLLSSERELFDAHAANSVTSSKRVTDLGDLTFAYTKHKSISDSFKKNGYKFSDVDADLFNQLKLFFVSEDSIKAGVIKYGVPYNDLANRQLFVPNSRPKPPEYVTTEQVVLSPGFMLTTEDFLEMTKLNTTQFTLDAAKKSEEYDIEIVYMPFINNVISKDTGGKVIDETTYIHSLGGLFVGGLYNYGTTIKLPPYSLIVDVPKSYTFGRDYSASTVNIWSNLNSINIKNILNVVPRSTFDKGVSLILYLRPYNTDELSDLDLEYNKMKAMNATWDASSYTQSVIATWGSDKEVTYVDDVQDGNDIEIITTAKNGIVFEDRLVLWSANKVYISEEGNYNYFTTKMKKEFPEEVLKVLAFKTILLVFTTQHLYAIHRVEAETPTGTFDDEGTPQTTIEVVWLQQPVLYNINPERRYLDVIQVYNQMILFYSNEGQLYMIRPSTTIDSETQFGIQYFNKSANAILANFHEYINERLVTYNKLEYQDFNKHVKKDDVQIKAIVDIDTIRLIYSVPDKITFILNYDVVNNRYTTYDTLNFTEVLHTSHIEGGELYLTKRQDKTYFTLPISRFNDMDLNVDVHYADSFKKEPIFTLLDSGNLNLNNHLTKRMRDLKITMKNIDSSKILYNAELLLDDTTVYPFYNNMFNVKMTNGPDSSITINKVPIDDMNELFGMDQTIGVSGDRKELNSYYLYDDNDFFNKNTLLRTETLNSSKLIEYNSSIISTGKVVRVKIQLISKGKYKLQSYGLVYKERRV